jgi:hypothetical protein
MVFLCLLGRTRGRDRFAPSRDSPLPSVLDLVVERSISTFPSQFAQGELKDLFPALPPITLIEKHLFECKTPYRAISSC